MNRRRFLTGLTAAFAAAPIAAKLAAVKPATVTLGDIITPEIFAPYYDPMLTPLQNDISNRVAEYWSQKLSRAFASTIEDTFR